MSINSNRYKSVLSFILSERILTLTVIASVITFQLLNTFKGFLFDPIMDFIMPTEKFDFLNVTIRDGYDMPMPDSKKLVLDFGPCLKEVIKWIFIIFLVFLLSKYTYLQDDKMGNPGVALM